MLIFAQQRANEANEAKEPFPRPILPKDRKTLVVESVGIYEIYGLVDFVGRGYGIWFWRISVIVVGALPPG